MLTEHSIEEMDCDLVRRRTRSGRVATQLVLLPDADISDPENESDSDFEQDSSSDSDSDHNVESDGSSSDDDLPLATYLTTQRPSTGSAQAFPSNFKHNFRWRNITAPTPHDLSWKGSLSDAPEEKNAVEYFK